MRGENIVIVGQQPWDTELGSNCKDIAVEFSRNNRVLYVNSPLDRYTSMHRKAHSHVKHRLNVVRGKENGFSQVKENLWVLYPDCMVESINWIELWSLFNLINKLNNKRFAKVIRRYLKELNFDKFILFNDNEIMKCLYLKEYLNPEIAVYYSRDFILAAPYWSKRAAILEPGIIRKSDLCVANSVYLTNYCKQYNPNAYYVGQGFNMELFNDVSQTRPDDIKNLTGTIIGYVGVLHSSRLDIETLVYIANSRPDWKLVLVGPEDQEFRRSELHRLPNVIFLGMKKSDELPRYINAFDVCINPQFLTPLTIGNYPRKIDEYLIMGKPVVALLTHAMEIFSEVTYLANNKEEYVDLIDLAIKEDCKELRDKRKTIAQSHSWENSVNAIYTAIKEVSETLS